MTTPLRSHADLLAALRAAERAGALDEPALCAWWKFSGDEDQRYYYSQVLQHVAELQRRLIAAQSETLRLTEILAAGQRAPLTLAWAQEN